MITGPSPQVSSEGKGTWEHLAQRKGDLGAGQHERQELTAVRRDTTQEYELMGSPNSKKDGGETYRMTSW